MIKRKIYNDNLFQYITLFFYLKFQLLYEMTKIPCVYIINEKLYVSCPSIIALIKKIHVIRLGGEVLAETFEKKITADEFWKIS